MELLEALLLATFTGVFGFFSNQLLHNLAVKKENIQVNRERLLLNIYKVDNYIKSLIEINYIRNEMKRIKIFIESLETNDELLTAEMNQIEEEINLLDDELNKYYDTNKSIDIKTKIRTLSTKLADVSTELKQNKIHIKTMCEDLALNDEILKKLNKSKYSEDIISALFLIDPTGVIVNDFSELSNIYLDSESTMTSDTRTLILRLKIEQFLYNKIKKFK